MTGLKRILNSQEERTHERLRAVCAGWDARVYAKLRVADVLPVEGSGISDEEFGFALRAHFDFVVADKEHQPLFVVEFDGPIHEDDFRQRRRDGLKNRLCKRFDCPMLRVNSAYILKRYRHVDVLTWLVEVWFSQRAFTEAQDRGQVPWDEGFTASFIWKIPGYEGSFPLWLSALARTEIRDLHERRKCFDAIPATAVARDSEENHHAIGYLRVCADAGLLAGVTMRSQQFYVPVEELLEDIVVVQLRERLDRVVAGEFRHLRSWDEIDRRCREFRQRFHVFVAGGPVPSPLLDSLFPQR